MKQYLLMTGLLALTACGPQAFVPSSSSSLQTPAGGINVPPKVDIVFGMSSNGTMRNIAPSITSEIPAFLQKLEKSGWDYRFISVSLSEYHPTTNMAVNGAVSVSKYDANYPVGTWLSPFPGADHNTAPRIASNLFASAFNVTQLQPTDPNDGHETGIRNQLDFVYRPDMKTDFLRPDALLAVISLSNNDDRSDWTYGADQTTDPGHGNVPLSDYANLFRNVKGTGVASLVRYYPLVAHLNVNCRSGTSRSGLRYEQMSDILGGAKSDICNVSISSSLDTVQANLDTVKLSYRKRYLVIGNPPNEPTIKVTKYLNGDAGQAQVLANDSNNGWTYAGAITAPTYLIDAPIPMNLVNPGDGYLIELHGSAKLIGNDTADVTFQNAGTVSSH